MKLANGYERDMENYVEKIKFKLHPSFSPSKIIIKKYPFSVERKGWGIFNIPIKIYWKYNFIEPTKLDHFLSFDGEGEQKLFTITVDKELIKKV